MVRKLISFYIILNDFHVVKSRYRVASEASQCIRGVFMHAVFFPHSPEEKKTFFLEVALENTPVHSIRHLNGLLLQTTTRYVHLTA